MPAEAAEVLETVADRFETGEYKWSQLSYWNRYNGTSCLVGGINRALGQQVAQPLPRIIRNAMSPYIGNIGDMCPEEWNDTHSREEVIDLLKHVAKDLRNQAGA
jgi:hypothetical protein